MARMKEFYAAEVAPALYKKFGYKSVMQIPKLDKVVVNVGCGEARDNHKLIDAIIADLTTITGQKAVPTKAKKSTSCRGNTRNFSKTSCSLNFLDLAGS